MLTQEHAETAQDFLKAADREFAEGDALQGSEKLWGAASHAVMTLAKQRKWSFAKHRHLKVAADRLAREYNDPTLEAGFFAAQQFHANFHHDFMEDDDIARGYAIVHRFVDNVLALYDDSEAGGPKTGTW